MKTGIYWQNPAYPAKGMDFIFDPSLVLYLPLYELDGASFMSRDAYGHLATVTGALWTPQGRSFDGLDDKINCGHHSAFDITEAITLEAWVRVKGPTWDDAGGIISKRVQGVDYEWYIRTAAANTFWGGVSTSSGEKLVGNNGGLTTDTWYHLVLVYDRISVRIYVNGALDSTPTAGTDAINTGVSDVHIGWYYSNVYAFDGRIGEVRIYNRALTLLEIKHNYLTTKWRYQ